MPDYLNLKLHQFAEQEKVEILSKITDLLLKRLIDLSFENLSEDNRKEFERLAESGKEEEIQKFIHAKIPNFEDLAKKELEKILESLSAALSKS